MQLNSILIYYGEPIEAFTDLKKFCALKNLNYNTYKQKKLPIIYNDFQLMKEAPGEISQYVERMGETIKIQ